MKLLRRIDHQRALIGVLLGVLAAGIVVGRSIVDPGINGYDRAMFPDMVYGKAHKPYVYRALVPSTIRALQAVVPQTVRTNLVEAADRNVGIVELFDRVGWETDYIVEYGVVVIISSFAHLTKR